SSREGKTMKSNSKRTLSFVLVSLMLLGSSSAQTQKSKSANPKPPGDAATKTLKTNGPPPNAPRPNLAKEPILYAVAYAHLDTEWRWEYPQVIQEYLTKTMRNNFAFFEKYPHYIFNFTGANRYRLMKEYYPSDFERLKAYVATGRWFPAG